MQNIKNILYYSVLAGIFIIPFIAFLVPTNMFFPFISGKGFTFRIIVEIIFGLYVLLALYEPKYRPKDSWITRAILLFIFVMFVANLFSENPYKSFWSNYERMDGFITIAHLALYYITVSAVLNSATLWKSFLNTSIVASGLMSFYGLLQVLGKVTINQGGVRVDATFGNSTYLAIYLVFHIFLCLYMLVRSKQSWLKYSYGALVILETVILYYTATRGAILGLIGGVFLAGVFVLWKERENKVVRKISYGFIGAILALVVVFIAIRQTSFVKNSPVLSRFSTLSFQEIKGQGRYYVWPMAIKGFQDRPILGWGQESFNYVFNKYYDARMYGQEEWFDRTHDIFLDWLIAGGILGLLSYLSIYFALLYYIVRKQSTFTTTEKGLLIGVVSAYLFHNIFVFDNLISYILFFTVLALVHSQNTYLKTGEGVFYKKIFSNDVLNYAFAPVILVLTIGVVYVVNIPALSANRVLIQAITPQSGDINKNLELFKKVYSYNSFAYDEATEQLIQAASSVSAATNIPEDIRKNFISLAEEKIKLKLAKTPNDARYLVFAGSFYNHLGRYDEGLVYLKQAAVESPNKQSILFETGTSYIGKGDLQSMFKMFKEAYELQPTAKESISVYTLGAIYTKNTVVLKEMSTKIDQSVVINDQRFLKAYSEIGDYNMVIQILEQRLKVDPKNAQNKVILASAYNTIGQKQKAIDILKEIAVDNPEYKDQVDQYIKEILGQ